MPPFALVGTHGRVPSTQFAVVLQSWGEPKLCPISWAVTSTDCRCGAEVLPKAVVMNAVLQAEYLQIITMMT